MKRAFALFSFLTVISPFAFGDNSPAVLANFENEKPSRLDVWAFSACRDQRPDTLINTTRELPAGEHKILVTSKRTHTNVENSTHEASLLVTARLESNKRYAIQQQLDGNSIKIWVIDTSTGNIVSDQIEGELKPIMPAADMAMKRLCKNTTT